MGHKRHDYTAMMTARSTRENTYGDAFAYDRTVRSTGLREIHASVNPAHGGIRHIADGELVTVVFDVTGSYSNVPRVVQEDLPELFARLVLNNWIPSKLNLQFGAIGDVYSDTAPVQLTQAEADGATADNWLANLWLEGGGGGSSQESYELMMWALCNQNNFGGWKEGRKGNAFIIFDEVPYPTVSASALRRLYNNLSPSTVTSDGAQLSERMTRNSLDAGDDSVVLPSQDISTEEMARQLREKYDVWCIMIKGTGYWMNPVHLARWRELFGEQNVLTLEHPENISELISGLMGAKYAAVEMGAIVNTLKGTIVGGDMVAIESAMRNTPSLPATVDFSVPEHLLPGPSDTSGAVVPKSKAGTRRL